MEWPAHLPIVGGGGVTLLPHLTLFFFIARFMCSSVIIVVCFSVSLD